MSIDIHNNTDESRFETTVDGQVAFAAYLLEPGRITFTHTTVPDELSGRGIAGQIMKHALEHARNENLVVVPQCSFVVTYIKRHPEYEELTRG